MTIFNQPVGGWDYTAIILQRAMAPAPTCSCLCISTLEDLYVIRHAFALQFWEIWVRTCPLPSSEEVEQNHNSPSMPLEALQIEN